MLLELQVENYAVIDRAAAAFDRGLNLMTGETGAGKSILIDALALLLGGKASADVIRFGTDRATLRCTFEETPGALAALDGLGLDADEDSGQIVLRREIAAGGKGRVWVNHQPANVAALRRLAPELALVHAQGETLASFDQSEQRELLDRFAGVETAGVRTAYAAWKSAADRLRDLETGEQERLRRADVLRYQLAEVEAAGLAGEDEDEALTAERRVLANAEKLHRSALQANEVLYEAENAAETTLGTALKLVEELARYEPRFAEMAAALAGARVTVEESSRELRDFAETVQSGEERLAEIEERLVLLDRLKRKYGATLGDVIRFAEQCAAELAEVDNRDALLAELAAAERAAAAAYENAAAAASQKRSAGAVDLAERTEAEINGLAMRVRLRVDVQAHPDRTGWAAHGWDTVGFLIATNAGEPLKPLDEIASGGEMSRVLLGLKVAVEDRAGGAGLGRTLVFDEIDIGIGGRAAEAVGQKLRALSEGQQVLCITHLPQIAAFANQHFVIEKREREQRTSTEIRRLDEGERVEEIARMLSGAKLTETSLNHARQLLEVSR